MITRQKNKDTVKINDLLSCNKNALHDIAVMLLANSAEMNVEMICAESKEYPTKQSIDQVFSTLHEQAHDFLMDYLDSLTALLEQELKTMKYTAQVRRLDYDDQGELSDITVEIKTESHCVHAHGGEI